MQVFIGSMEWRMERDCVIIIILYLRCEIELPFFQLELITVI